jgi:hypothetical protein
MLKSIAAFFLSLIVGLVGYEKLPPKLKNLVPPPETRIVASPAPEPTAPLRTQSIAPAQQITVKIFLIGMEDKGVSGKLIGCDDSAIAVQRTTTLNTSPLYTAMSELLAQKDKYYGQSGLYNSLYNSNLRIDSISTNAGRATIKLVGTYSLAGTCDDPRFKAQLEETALQFPQITSVEIFINNIPLKQILSGAGR